MSKDKITEILEGAFADDEPSVQKIQQDNKLAVMGDGTTINIMESPAPKEDQRYDDSAEVQGRKKVSLRQHGDPIDPKHMTPKEYRNFTGGIWDGIERRDGIYNWTPYTFVKASDKPVERRNLGNRRKNKQSYKGKNNRANAARRFSDKLEVGVYYFCFSFSFLIFLFFLIGALIKEGVLNV